MRWARSTLAGAAAILLASACGTGSSTPAGASPSSAYVPWLPLAATGQVPLASSPSPNPPPSVAAGMPRCGASQLEGMFNGSGGGAGHPVTSVSLRNRSAAPCYLFGYPDITIVDALGRVLARAAGTAQRGTFVDPQGAAVPAPMSVGALPLGASEARAAVPGEAYMNVEWYDCRAPMAANLLVDLPMNGGRLTVAYAIPAPYSPVCDGLPPGSPTSHVARGPFIPYDLSEAQPTLLPVTIALRAPATAKRGSTLTYLVVVTNSGSTDYSLNPCPDYFEAMQAKVPVATYRLNCGPVGHIAPGESVTFEMRLTLPMSMATGPNSLLWSLIDLRLEGPPEAKAAIEVA
jgi:hypothetical protein